MPDKENSDQNKMMGQPGQKPTVLIVEDDHFLRDLVARKLEVSGFVVLQAIDGAEGLSILKDHTPDVVLLDMVLPGMSGLDILKSIKSNPKTQSIPVVILSNLGQKGDMERAKELGADGYMVKAHTDLGEIVKTVVATQQKSSQKQKAI
mgnify:CR=1 FL=1